MYEIYDIYIDDIIVHAQHDEYDFLKYLRTVFERLLQ